MEGKILDGRRVLIVEDEPLIAALVAEYLEDFGCTVIATAGRVDQALADARALDLTLAVLDLNLAGTSSAPVGEVLLERGIPFVIATGADTQGVDATFAKVPKLAKPFAYDAFHRSLLDAVQQQLPSR